MNQKRKEAPTPLTRSEDISAHPPILDSCKCLPLSSFCIAHFTENEGGENVELTVPTTQALYERIRPALEDLCKPADYNAQGSQIAPFSILLLHVSQLEHPHITPYSATLRARQRYHASGSLLEQILVNVRRAVREGDQIIAHAGIGAAILLPNVDQHGTSIILERVYRSISLLQAETIIPPLTRETDIVLGMGSYPEPAQSLEQVLAQTGTIARRLVLRPAINIHFWNSLPVSSSVTPEKEEPALPEAQQSNKRIHTTRSASGRRRGNAAVSHTQIPFMDLPLELPTRLKHLIPYEVAQQYRCAPVGRDHYCLTVAMAEPTNLESIRQLRELTGMTIFPVSCEEEALNTLLTRSW